jgi:hypothetical protein
MSALNWAALAVAVISIITGFTGSIRWLVKHYLSELKPNSGSSLRDQVTRLEARVDTIISLLEKR